tara:strand:+ start:108971 stop:109756 length:786 start_codon:yes stop_codon:yes gene_type:complete
MQGIDFMYKHLGHKLAEEFEPVPATQDSCCSCCKRPSAQWVDSDLMIPASEYGRSTNHCMACHTLFHPSFERLGHEGMKGSKPTALKLGMLKGCGALITPNESILYAPKKYFPKFTACKNSIFDAIIDQGGKAVVDDVLAKTCQADLTPFLFIHNFGVKKAELVANLQVSEGQAIAVCSEEWTYELPYNFSELQAKFQELEKKQQKAWLDLFKRSSSRGLTPEEVTDLNQLTNSIDGFVPLLQTLTHDPHVRIKIAQLLGG